MLKKLLWVVDYQKDFVDGVLGCGEPAIKIEPKIKEKIQEFPWDEIVFTRDTHSIEENKIKNIPAYHLHPESKMFPPHCLFGTDGWEIYGDLKKISDNSDIVFKIDKKSYGISPWSIEDIVRDYQYIELCGIATDICVLQNAILLYNASIYEAGDNKIEFAIDPSCCASFSEEGHNWAINYIVNTLGFKKVGE